MLGSEILEIALGLIFMYMLLSTVCSALQEAVASVLNLRARNLNKAIENLLGPQHSSFFNHALMRTMRQPTRSHGWGLPSYIPARTFAAVVMDLVMQRAPEPVPARGTAAAEGPDAPPGDQGPRRGAMPFTQTSARDLFEQGIKSLDDKELQDALVTVLTGTGLDLAAAREAIEKWFNDSMERASGWYKRKAQLSLCIIAFLVVGVSNADTISVARSLAVDDELRQTVAENATRAVQVNAEDCDAASVEAPDVDAAIDSVERAVNKLEGSELPLGWSWDDVGLAARNPMDEFTSADLGLATSAVLIKLPGLLITVFAVMLGAPFWFDLLSKIANLRGAGPKPGDSTQKPPSTIPRSDSQIKLEATSVVAEQERKPTY